MKIRVRTRLPYDYKYVFDCMNQEMLEFLSPKKQVKLIQYDGNVEGGLVDVQILRPWRTRWTSRIIKVEVTDKYALFVDIGEVLPFGMNKWTHNHYVNAISENECEIFDDIEFSTKYWVQGWFIYLPMLLSFRSRKKGYPKFFLHKQNS